MNAGLIFLTLGYVLSQFFRAFLAVMTDVLGRDLGVGPDELATASGLWFLSFAVMQIPVGWALDVHGPRRTASVLLLLGGAGGAVVFALAQSALHINIAMLLIGVGCSPVLMASFFLFARQYSAAMFATLAAVMIGVGSLGNLAGAGPLALAVESFGWRESLWGLAVVTGVIAAGILAFVKDPEKLDASEGGTVLSILAMPALWLIFPLMLVGYAPAGALRGLWIGPYMTDIQGGGAALATTIMACAMIAGTFIYGPLDRVFGTRKWVVFGGNALALVCLFALALGLATGYWSAVILFAGVGLFGLSFPVIMAHGRAFLPAHLTGRGITLMNLFGIGGVGLSQMISGRLFAAQGGGAAGHDVVLMFFAVILAVGLVIYGFCQDRTD
ncbi:MAG: MFS transporter [Pseudomonadota bacterium]